MRESFRRIGKNVRENVHILAIALLVCVVIFIILFNRIVIFVGSGEGAVLYRLFFGGTVVNRVYPEGIHFIWPWDKMYIYNLRVQETPHEFDVLTKTGLKVSLNISIRCYPEEKMIGVLQKTVGQDYVKVVVVPQIDNVLRVVIGQLDMEDIYMTKQGIIEKSINEAAEQISRRYINVDAVIIKKIILPPSIEKAIQEKMEQKQLVAGYLFKIEKEKLERERKRIEAEGLKIFRKSLSRDVLQWMGIQATLKLAESPNSKVVIVGTKEAGFNVLGNVPLNFPDPSEKADSSETSDKKEPETKTPGETSSETPSGEGTNSPDAENR